ncbi:TPA: hypothetical protein ACH3X3_004341 [Trebouxia sp. C0006]
MQRTLRGCTRWQSVVLTGPPPPLLCGSGVPRRSPLESSETQGTLSGAFTASWILITIGAFGKDAICCYLQAKAIPCGPKRRGQPVSGDKVFSTDR